MSAYRTSKKCRLSYIVLSILLALIVLIGYFCYQLSLHLDEVCRSESKLLAVEMINSAVEETLSADITGELIKETKDEKGNVVALSLDPVSTNKINNIVSQAVSRKIRENENKAFNVPIGTLSGIPFLNGRGFDLDLRLNQIGLVTTRIRSEFEACGINQTRYKVYIEINVELNAIMSVNNAKISVEHQYLIGEKVIVGDVPQSYFSI
ncbi:sporulation protein YunB [Ruminococcus sp. FC2018]|uniref:sporulation protein YunB n=1 Tax=Ruminococcus sp. FC2018 TaxID=1410617 RepID=UPI00048D0D93|nr:sporulation protein YunB [Ruminococcus sp. FC2018]